MSQETKRHHYVPQTYLKKFGFERKKDEYQVFVADKDRLDKAVFVNTSKICIQTDLYTLKGNTEEERQAIEKFYCFEVESSYDDVYKILTDDGIREIDDKTKERIVLTMITLLFRVTNWISVYNSLIGGIFENNFTNAKKLGKDSFYFGDRKIEIAGKTANQLISDYIKEGRENQIITQLVAALRLSKIRRTDNLSIVKIEHEGGFITSDNPIILRKSGGGHIAPFSPDNLIHLPLNEKYRLTLYPRFDKIQPNYIGRILHKGEMADREITISNLAQYQQAEKFIIGNEEQLTSFKGFLERCKRPVEPSEELKERLKKIQSLANKIGLK